MKIFLGEKGNNNRRHTNGVLLFMEDGSKNLREESATMGSLSALRPLEQFHKHKCERHTWGEIKFLQMYLNDIQTAFFQLLQIKFKLFRFWICIFSRKL